MNKTPHRWAKNRSNTPTCPSHDATTVHPTIESPSLHATIESVNAEKNTRATRATLDKKTSDIAAMFDTVAERYDLMNGILSLGQHIYWRKQAVAAVDAHPGQKVLDVAAGTGVSSEPFADAGVDVIAADLSEGMLDVGRRRRPDMTFVQADVTALPFGDDAFDAVTMSYGLRNVADYPKALSEIYRVLKPGGRIVILEFSTPTFAPFGAVYKNYIMKAIPPIARAISSNPESYEYLAESIIAWPNQQALAEKFKEAGFASVQYRNLTGGIVAIHRGFKPAGPNA